MTDTLDATVQQLLAEDKFIEAGHVLEEAHRFAEASVVYEVKAGDNQRAARAAERSNDYLRAARLYSSLEYTDLITAFCLAKAGQLEDALKIYQDQNVQMYPDFVTADISVMRESSQKGKDALSSGDLSTALKHFELLVKKFPGHDESRLYLGIVHHAQGNKDKARKEFRLVVGHGLTSVEKNLYLAAAKAHAQIDDESFAQILETTISHITDASPLITYRDAFVKELIGVGYRSYKSGDLPQAARKLGSALVVQPTNTTALDYFVKTLRRLPEGTKYEFPPRAEAVLEIGKAFAKQQDYQTARSAFDYVVELGGHPDIDATIGAVLKPHLDAGDSAFKKGDIRTAGKNFGIVLVIEPDNVTALYYLGRCMENARKPQQALTYYQRVYSLDPTFADVAKKVEN